MGRRPKAETDKRTERLMIYLTPEEAAELAAVAEHQNTDKAKFVVAAIQSAIDGLTSPPESLAVSRAVSSSLRVDWAATSSVPVLNWPFCAKSRVP